MRSTYNQPNRLPGFKHLSRKNKREIERTYREAKKGRKTTKEVKKMAPPTVEGSSMKNEGDLARLQ